MGQPRRNEATERRSSNERLAGGVCVRYLGFDHSDGVEECEILTREGG